MDNNNIQSVQLPLHLPSDSFNEAKDLLGKCVRSLSVTRKNLGILSVSERLQRADPRVECVLLMVASLTAGHVVMCCGLVFGVWCW